MEIIIKPTAAELAVVAAEAICEVYADNPAAVLGVATGSSPLPIYQELSRRVQAGSLSLRHAKAFQLDEYVGLPQDHPEVYHNFIRREFASITDIDPSQVYGEDGLASDLLEECRRYEQAIVDAGGIDIQILGIGVDGHIAFNEPGTSLNSLTHPAVLTAQTRRDNARFFSGDIDKVPTHALTQGVGTILRARKIVLLATGANKADAVRDMVEGPVSISCTGSALQLHNNVKVLLDEAAAAKLERQDFYREIYANRPQGAWLGL
ncbi:glucosamine-6-phosphate deaminase [Mobiluncus curtisii]|uniref:glucosamine-6-phosphate deaminase n=1 Tax=Mobiluncus curtisii TaxID=2051 RepID=UPI0014707499|nr:glucosamine-6-phosphate deaminase [Mobiluncus curtisii]NMW89564.1 glucosamine-6-phosphate deaminase [Mobiluncus curtisii]